MERVDFEAQVLAITHGVANVIAAGGFDFVEMGLQIGDLEQVVVLAAAEQQNRLAFVLPIARVLLVWSDAPRVFRSGWTGGESRRKARENECAEQHFPVGRVHGRLTEGSRLRPGGLWS